MSVDFLSKDIIHKVKIQKETRIVPWYNVSQFKQVYECLYSSELVKKRWAVDQISVWETRCHPSLPAAIEASLVISRAIIQDVILNSEASFCQERDIQMMYSMALVRFVNLTIELHQKFQPNLITTAQIAKGLGIPSWIVDLRNEATHSFWPSLPSLRLAAETAMKYLNESFWVKEISRLKCFEKEPVDDTEINVLIRNYIALHFYVKQEKGKQMQYELIEINNVEFSSLLQKLISCIKKNKRQFVRILISDGLFIPLDEDLNNMLSPDELIQYNEKYSDEYDGQRLIPPVPTSLENLWKRLLKIMNMLHIIPIFLESLLKSHADRSEVGKKLVTSWIMRILRIHAVGDCFVKTPLKKIFRKKGIVANWHNLFYIAVSRPCLYTPCIFPLIFSHLDLTEDATKYIMRLMAIILGLSNDDRFPYQSNHSAFTLENLMTMKQKQEAKKGNKIQNSEECIWSVVPDTSYKSWPIGAVVNRIDDREKRDEELDNIKMEIKMEVSYENMDFPEKFIFSNENDNEEYFVINNEPDISEDEMELDERATFLYKKK